MTLEYRQTKHGDINVIMTECPHCGTELPDGLSWGQHWRSGECEGNPLPKRAERERTASRRDNVTIGHIYTATDGFKRL